MSKEIGGYIELEHFHGPMLHEDGILLDCGRSCLAYLIRAKNIQKIAIPSFMCDSVFDLCRRYDVQLRFYQVGLDFLPERIGLEENEYLYLVNYYGQLNRQMIVSYRDQFKHVIVDNTQAYFDEPVSGVDTYYTCRKFFGVPDGGILYTDTFLDEELEQSESWNHMEHILGRFERTASEFYVQSITNNKRFRNQPVRRMSKITKNLLHAIDYDYVKTIRTSNYLLFFEHFNSINQLRLQSVEGAFAYPLMIENADSIRKKLVNKKIYVPVLWPNVPIQSISSQISFCLSTKILPLPVDQRYGKEDIIFLCDTIINILRDENVF